MFFSSVMKKALQSVIYKVFPSSDYSLCVIHLMKNVKTYTVYEFITHIHSCHAVFNMNLDENLEKKSYRKNH